MWDTIKRPNLLIIVITEAEESQIFNKITEANFPQIKKGYTHTDIGSTQNTKQSQKRNTPQHIIAKNTKDTEQIKNPGSCQGKNTSHI